MRAGGAPLDVCVKCRRTFYCCKACQTADLKRGGGGGVYRAECNALIAEAKASKDARERSRETQRSDDVAHHVSA